jgi:hypothetical protein
MLQFADQVAALFDLSVEAAVSLLQSTDDPTNWVSGPAGGTELLYVVAGPKLAGAEAGLVRYQPGTPFPRRRHLGHEHTLVLLGAFRE